MTKRKLNTIEECILVEEDALAETNPTINSSEEEKVGHSDSPTVSETPEGVETNQRPLGLAHVAGAAELEPPPVHGFETSPRYATPIGSAYEVTFDPNRFWSLLELAGYEVWYPSLVGGYSSRLHIVRAMN